MRGLFTFAVATAVAFISRSLAVPITAMPGGISNLQVTAKNTLNGTLNTNSNARTGSNPLKISFYNNLGSDAKAYITGMDSNNRLVLVTASSTFYYPAPSGGGAVAIPTSADIAIGMGSKGQTTTITIPDYITAGRIWVAQGGNLQFISAVDSNGRSQIVEPSFSDPSDPSAAVDWGFVELSNNAGGLYANLSFVDFVGLVMGMTLRLGNGEVQTVEGLQQGAITDICNDLRAQSRLDGQPWDQMCITNSNGTPLRVLSPNQYRLIHSGAMESYYANYIDQVWDKYTNQDLTVDTQSSLGKVTCRVSSGVMRCNGLGRTYAKPTTYDVLKCNDGPFGNSGTDPVIPRLCAAFHRGTFLSPGGDVQPSLGKDSYYTADPTNHYNRIVHKYEVDGRGYTFPYDDVNPDGENEAGVVAGSNPQVLEIRVGGP